MYRTILFTGIAGLALSAGGGAQAAVPEDAATAPAALIAAATDAAVAPSAGAGYEIARRGRGRGGDDARGDDRGRRGGGHGADDHDDDSPSGSGRRKPRIPGGSGCDDPGDIAEHPECRG